MGFTEPGRLLRLLESGNIDSELAVLAPALHEPWRLTRLAEEGTGGPVVPVSWNAVGVDEQPALDRVHAIEEGSETIRGTAVAAGLPEAASQQARAAH